MADCHLDSPKVISPVTVDNFVQNKNDMEYSSAQALPLAQVSFSFVMDDFLPILLDDFQYFAVSEQRPLLDLELHLLLGLDVEQSVLLEHHLLVELDLLFQHTHLSLLN